MSALLAATAVLGTSGLAFADPTPRECATASEEALSLRKQEKLKDAKDRLLICSAPSCPAEVRDECARRMPDVTEAIPTVVFDVKDTGGNDLSAVRVSMDGALLIDHVSGSALAVDPGEHTFRFESAGAAPIEKRMVIREGEHARHVDVTVGGSEQPMAVAPTPGAAPDANRPLYATADGSQAATPAPSTPSSWSGQKTAAVVVGGVGVLGIIVGSVFGARAFSKWSDAKDACGSGCSSSSSAQSLKSDAQSAATGSTVAFIVGGAGIVGGAVLWLTAPSGAQVQVAPTVGGFQMRGTF